MTRNYWQVSAGGGGRDYKDAFIRHGIAFAGDEPHESIIQRVKPGDVVILRGGMTKVLAAGEVVERNGRCCGRQADESGWLWDFDGWALPAYCYVDWRVPKAPVETRGLTRSTIQRAHKSKHHRIADDLVRLDPFPIEPEPPPTRKVEDAEILESLIGEGLRPGAADDLTATFRRIRLLARYYYKAKRHKWEDIREHETRTFLAVPLLLALGWSEQQIKIELPAGRGRVDIACFSRPYRQKNDECRVLIETKDFSSGLDQAVAQATGYAKHFPRSRVMVVTNGHCYKTYRRDGSDEFSSEPSAYLNLLRPRDRYPVDPKNVDGALQVLKDLLPRHLD